MAIHRKIRMRLVTGAGMRMFSTLFTCIVTWRKRGLDPTEQLLRVSSGST